MTKQTPKIIYVNLSQSQRGRLGQKEGDFFWVIFDAHETIHVIIFLVCNIANK